MKNTATPAQASWADAMRTFDRDLQRRGAAERTRVGGKAAVLGELAAAGLPVPPGFVVTAADLDADGWELALAEAAGETEDLRRVADYIFTRNE